jgi:hypothetical protein
VDHGSADLCSKSFCSSVGIKIRHKLVLTKPFSGCHQEQIVSVATLQCQLTIVASQVYVTAMSHPKNIQKPSKALLFIGAPGKCVDATE